VGAPPTLLWGGGTGSPDPLRVPAGGEEPLPTARLLPSRWSRAGLRTGGIQAIWSCAGRRRRKQQLEPGSALPPNPVAQCTGGIRGPQAPLWPQHRRRGRGDAGDQRGGSQRPRGHPAVLRLRDGPGHRCLVGGGAAGWGN